MKKVVIIVGLFFSCWAHAYQAHLCESDALQRARPLLTLHIGEDDRMSFSDRAEVLPSIKNPANAKQQLAVLEVNASVYKGQYRMRFIYYVMPDSKECLLMGQEILELANV